MLILDIQHVEFNHLYILEEQKENHLKLLLKLLQIFFFFLFRSGKLFTFRYEN